LADQREEQLSECSDDARVLCCWSLRMLLEP